MKISRDVLKKLPKVDLHCHLDGSIRTRTIRDLANEQGVKLPTQDLEELRKHVSVSPDCRSLGDFLLAFEFFYPLLKNAKAMERISYELCEDARNENVIYIEMRFAPALQATDGFRMEDVVKAVLKGISRAKKDFGVDAAAILCCYRSVPEKANMETVELAKAYLGKGVVGLDLAGDESRYPTKMYTEPFKTAKKAGIPATVHAGEAAGPESIKDALELLCARRIGHGIALEEEPALMDRFKKEKIPLEICITSNVQTQVVKSYERHPVKRFYDYGLEITLNTDDRSVSGIDLTGELGLAMDKFGFNIGDIEKIMINNAENAFRDGTFREGLRKSVEKGFREVL